jgi:hypothetical protein
MALAGAIWQDISSVPRPWPEREIILCHTTGLAGEQCATVFLIPRVWPEWCGKIYYEYHGPGRSDVTRYMIHTTGLAGIMWKDVLYIV